MGLRPKRTLFEKGNDVKIGLGRKIKKNKRGKLSEIKINRRTTGSPTTKVRINVRSSQEKWTSQRDWKNVALEESPLIISTKTSYINSESKKNSSRLLKSTERKNQGKILFRKKANENYPKMYWTQFDCQRI